MKKYIKKIFQEENYLLEKDSSKENLLFLKKWEYFLISEYNKIELKGFFESEKTSKIIDFFNNKKKIYKDIEKNTSLIILLKVKYLEKDFDEIKNQIMKIEEDEYFFRKYVIVYDDKWKNNIKSLSNIQKLNNELIWIKDDDWRIIKKWIDLDKFRKNNFENSKYYLIMQLFIKLPFLKVKVDELKLGNLLENINKEIKKNKLEELNNFILEEKYLSENETNDDFFENLEKNILDIWDKEIDNFLKKITK